jgi:signal peptidase I
MAANTWILVVGAVVLFFLIAIVGGIYFIESKAGMDYFPGLNEKYCRQNACQFIQIVGNSMNPTLQTNHRALFVSGYYSSHPLERGDIVLVASVVHLGKRLVALPGDKLELRGNDLYLNGVLLQEPYLQEPVDASHYAGLMQQLQSTQFIVPVGNVIVFGDNRNNSTDSGSLGPIPQNEIAGKIVPISAMDFLFQ